MKTLLIILGYVAAVLSVVFSVTPLYKIAILTGSGALLFGLFVFLLNKQAGQGMGKSVKVLFAITLIALLISAYKTWFVAVEVGNTEDLIEMEDQSELEAIEALEDLDIEEFEDIDAEEFEDLNQEEEVPEEEIDFGQ